MRQDMVTAGKVTLFNTLAYFASTPQGAGEHSQVLTTACCQPNVCPQLGDLPVLELPTADTRGCLAWGHFQLVAVWLWTASLIHTDKTASQEVPTD